jgi:hypothetical protein
MTNASAPGDPALVQFGLEVKAARVRAGKRAGELYPELGISRAHYHAIEAGTVRASDACYWRIANALDLDPAAVVREQVAS